MAEVKYNKSTGQAVLFDGTSWVDTPVKHNKQTGESVAFDGEGWSPVGVVSKPEMSDGVKAARIATLGAKGFSDTAAEAIGAIPELVASGMRAVGLENYAPEEGFYPNVIKQGVQKFGEAISPLTNALPDLGPAEPQSAFERGAVGAGSGVANAASFMLPGAVISKFAPAGSVLSGVGGAMASQPLVQLAAGGAGGGVAEGTGSEMAGLVTGLAVPTVPALIKSVGRRAITPFANQLSNNEQKLAKAAEKIGIKLTPGQATGSPGLRTMESSFGQLPLTAKSQGEIYGGQRSAFNKAVLGKAGINASEASPEVLDDAFRAIGKEFDDLASKTVVKVDQKFVDDIAGVASNYGRRLPTDVAPVFKSYIDDLAVLQQNLANNPQIAGQEYQKISSAIKRRARSAGNNPDLQEALLKLSTTLDDTLERSGGPALKGAWQDVRNRYRNMLTVDRAMGAGTQTDRSAANIPFSGLRTAVKGMDKSGYSRGRGDLNELSRVGDFLGSAIPPDSGTARRSMMQSLLTFGGPGAAGGFAAAGGNPAIAAMVAALSVGGPKAAQMAYSNPTVQAYLKNQLLQPQKGPAMAEMIAKIAAAQQLGNTIEPTMQNALGGK